MKDQATPRPWEIISDKNLPIGHPAFHNQIRIVNYETKKLICLFRVEDESNAKLIVKAVNSNDELVKALESILITPLLTTDHEKLDGTHEISFTISMDALNKAKKAISKCQE